MRFFLEFVSCCGSPTQNKSEANRLPTEDEERWLVPAPTLLALPPDSSARTKRGKKRQGGHEWRPSLGSISEDFTTSARERNDSPNGAISVSDLNARINASRGGGRAGGSKARQRSYSEGDYRGGSMPMIMPAFSPTPFMF